MGKPTQEQMEHFYELQKKEIVNSANFQSYLENPNGFLGRGLPVTYDQSMGIRKLAEKAVGPNNLGNINSDITPERFPLKGTGARKVKARVVPYLDGETSEEIAVRLAGCAFGNTGDLAGFLHDHPEEVEKWGWVLAISEDSRWSFPDGGYVYVPRVRVDGARRGFYLYDFRLRLYSYYGVLVLCE